MEKERLDTFLIKRYLQKKQMVDAVQAKPEACPRITLNNGTKIPVLGLGTFLMSDNPKEMVKKAILEYGYRHIDTAHIYANEEQIGEAL